jgi:hypothetical protein
MYGKLTYIVMESCTVNATAAKARLLTLSSSAKEVILTFKIIKSMFNLNCWAILVIGLIQANITLII